MTFAKTKSPFTAKSVADIINDTPTSVKINLEGLDFKVVGNDLIIETGKIVVLPHTSDQCHYMKTQLNLTEDQVDRVMNQLYVAVSKELVINLLSDRVV